LAGPRVATWSATDELQTAPATTPIDLAGLAERALGQRLDLAAARRDLESIDAALEFSQSSPFYIFEAGLSVERDTDRLTLVGPQISIDLPFFDRRQAQIQKLEAMRRQLLQRERNLSNEIRSEVRDASLALTAARDRAEVYRTGVIPERERVVELLQERYNAMLAGVFDLLRAKQNETAAYSEYLETLRDYWIAVARLEYQLGGPLTGEPGALDQSVQTQEK
ncbi:MAG: TolC family protein, partial [Leptospirales bacterium]